MYNAVGADIIRLREAESLPYGFYRWAGALFNEAEETTEPSPCPLCRATFPTGKAQDRAGQGTVLCL